MFMTVSFPYCYVHVLIVTPFERLQSTCPALPRVLRPCASTTSVGNVLHCSPDAAVRSKPLAPGVFPVFDVVVHNGPRGTQLVALRSFKLPRRDWLSCFHQSLRLCRRQLVCFCPAS